MAKKKKTSAKKGSSFLSRLQSPSGEGQAVLLKEMVPNIESTTITKFIGSIVFLLGVLFVFALFGSGGYVGSLLLSSLLHTLGFFGYFSFLYFWFIGYCVFTRSVPAVPPVKLISGVGFVLSITALFNVETSFQNIKSGGLIGNILGLPFYSLFSYYPALLFLLLLTMYCLLVLTGIEMSKSHVAAVRDKMSFLRSLHISPNFLDRFKRTREDYVDDEDEYEEEDLEPSLGTDDIRSHILEKPKKASAFVSETEDEEEYEEEEDIEEETPKKRTSASKVSAGSQTKRQTTFSAPIRDFTPPPLSLLQRDSGKASVGDTKTNMSVIKRTLAEFGIQVEMDEVSIGPSVTRYALKPAQGVKLSRIANHRQELAYALRAESIRIEAPIPGKALVGIEIPNETKSMVGLATLFSAPGWTAPDKPLLVALGKGISGTPLFSNLAKMPHLLIAGTTGSGKSVMVHTIINSLIFRNSPQDLKFIMVDPKKVELTLYNNIPHLYTPVITNPKLTIRTLDRKSVV